ncbi:MAG TPA: pilus assembly protein N-terminal domain-containing protein [Burkholderiales bacterium]|nr:pilus assembly protein N-terminal domain-containing protein [Burkholderiales bacterium]
MKTFRRLAIFVLMVMPPAFSSSRVVAAGEPLTTGTEQIVLLVGRSAVVHTDRAIQRVSLSTADIADAMVTAPRELLVHAKAPGTISLLVWSDNGRITNYEVVVRRDLTALEGQIRRQFPNEPIAVAVNGKDVVLSGVVSAKHVIDTAKALAVGYVEKPENVVNMLRQTENAVTNQVMLQVRFAEVSRSAMQELGANFFGGPTGADGWQGRATTQQFAAPTYDGEKSLWQIPDFQNLFAFQVKDQLGVTIRALKGKGLFESLAEPNLVTQDGKEASFLAGGEFPYPVVQGGGANQSVTIVFKEFGVRLRFTPTITGGGYVHLKVMPEVSTLDFANGVTMEGFRVPALSTRRTETEVELRDGQTFAISGLLDRNMDETLRRVPGIGDIPILGKLFRSQAYKKNTTELVVMITPYILRRDSPGVTPNMPGLVEPFLPPPTRTIPMPPPAFSGLTPDSPAGPTRTVVSNTSAAPVAPSATVAPVAPAAPIAPGLSSADRREAARAKNEIARLEREQAERDRKAAEIEAARAAVAEQKQKKDAEIARKAELVRQQREKVLEEKRLEDQAAIDRKRWIEQQEQAAKAKVVADKLAKEQARRDVEQQKIENARLEEERRVAEKHQKAQEKLAREQASRNGELEKLITQYKRLTGE